MFKKRKKVKKIVLVFITIIMTLGFYINFSGYTEASDTQTDDTVASDTQTDDTVGLDHGTINPIYRPKWEKVSSSFSASDKTLSVIVKGAAYESKNINANTDINYASNVTSTLKADDITVFIDGVEVTDETTSGGNQGEDSVKHPTVEVEEVTNETNETSKKNEITYKITISNLEEKVRQAGKNYKEWSGNVSIKIAGRGQDESTYNENVLTDEAGNQSMMEIQKDGTWINIEIQDTKTDHNTVNEMFADYVSPEITYIYSNGNIDYTNKTLTVEFSVVDKYFSSSKLSEENATDNIKIKLLDTDKLIPDANITKTLTKTSDITETRDNETVKIGEKYKLVIGGLEQKTIANGDEYRNYSGPMSITFPENIAEDKSGNTNIAKTITIGVNEPDNTGNQEIVDIVDPVWTVENVQKVTDSTTGKITATMDLYGTDKYYASNSLTADKIQVIVDGVDITSEENKTQITRTLTKVEDLAYGVHYKFTLTDLEESDELFKAERDKYATDASTGRVYREYSGNTTIIIPENTIIDSSNNKNQKLEIPLDHIDTIAPEIIKVSSTKDSANNKETIVFDVVDKYLDTSAITTTDTSKIHVMVDDEEATSITKTIKSIEDLKATIDGTTKVVGKRYTLELTDFEEARTTINRDREFTDWSGTVSIKIDAGTATDTSGNKNKETTLKGDFVDFIKPDITYKYLTEDIDKNTKSFKMAFDVTDKYYESGKLTLDDLTIQMTNGKLDANNQEKIYDLKNSPVTITLNSDEQVKAKNIKKTNTATGKVETVAETVIGTKYVLTISGLENLDLAEGSTTLDYSGIVTVGIAKDKIKDTSKNSNLAKTITSGVDIPGGDTGDTKVVDVVKPIWSKVNGTVDLKATPTIATLTVNATDTYFANSTLTNSNIKVFADGAEITSQVTLSVSGATALKEDRMVNGTISQVQYGNQYTISVKGYPIDKKQVKIRILADTITDKYGNKSLEKEFLVYNTLKSANVDSDRGKDYIFNAGRDKSFLGNTTIKRPDIDNITFVDNIPISVYDKTTKVYKNDTAWDVSAVQDKSIIAWYETNDNGTFKVYIGSDDEIFGNIDSSYLFTSIGTSNKCTSTETITNIELLNTTNVTNMSFMFDNTGYTAMTSLNLGDNFDTSNVTSMNQMFARTGYTAMTSLDLGDKFDTSNVTSMKKMFVDTGYTAMTSLDLGDKFDTSNVTSMWFMFCKTGYTAMTSLDLGDKFDTSNVTDMSEMFTDTGYTAMTSLDLGDKFSTSKVTNMTRMFYDTGATAMTSLNLGDNFDTSNVTSMTQMFWRTGATAMTSLNLGDNFDTSNVTRMSSMFEWTGFEAMTSLDLGPAFTKIADSNADIFTGTGKSGSLIIQAPEAIYQDSTHFKTGTDSETTIQLTTGTINPKYRTEWIKEGTTIDTTDANTPKIKIKLRGTTNTAVSANEYTSDVTSTLTTDQIKILIDGEDITQDVTKKIGTATQTTNEKTGAKDVLQEITLSNFEKGRLGKSYKEWSGNITIEVAQGTAGDKYGNHNVQINDDGTRIDDTLKTETVSKNTANSLFADFIKPEFTYKASDTTIVHGEGEKVEITFDVVDKYFESTTLSNLDASQITVGIDDYDKTELNKAINKTLEKVQDITDTVDGVENTKIGERYKLTITGLDQEGEDGIGDGYKYSGYMSLAFEAGTVKDKSQNKSAPQTITIGKNEPDGTGNGTIVDVVDPVWSVPSVDTDNGIVKIRVKDKFLTKDSSIFNLKKEDIQILVNDTNSTAIIKTLTGPEEIVANQEYEYTLTLTNITPADGGYTEFTPIDPIVGNTAKYRNENGGDISLIIKAGVVTDQYGNSTKQQKLYVGNIDSIGPEIYKVQKIEDVENNKATIIFNVTDKNYDSSKLITTDEMTIWMDGTKIDNKVTKTITKSVEIKTIIDGKEKVVGHQYTLELTPIVETDEQFITSTRDYRELSGTLEVKIDKTAARDIKGNTINEETTTISEMLDMINPEVKYKYSTADINKDDKTFTMEFDMIDKYYDSTKSTDLTTNDLKIKVDDKDIDTTKVTVSLQVENKTSIVNGESKVIGKHYALTLSNLEQLQIKEGDNYLDYSGVITVAIPADKMVDTSGNKNIAKTITSGIDIPGGDASGSGEIVDVVDPLWEKVSGTTDIKNKTATVTIKGTDKYFANSTLKKDDIKLFVDGVPYTGATIELSSATTLTEQRTSGGNTTSVQYGVQYTVTVSNYPTDKNQVAFGIPSGILTDKFGNSNKDTIFRIYNTLKSANVDSDRVANSNGFDNTRNASKAFLGNTNIQRKNIDNITFVDNIPTTIYDKSAKEYKNDTAWDVSAAQDKSIIAWYETNANGTVKVYIGSDDAIFGNVDSSYLFAGVGSSDNCATTETITNIGLLNTTNVTNMSCMFADTGSEAMTALDLGNNFDTSNVTNMSYMFEDTGYTAMTSLNLGENFDTSNVTNMSKMFSGTGYVAMTSLDLGERFDTSKVTDMGCMFECTGFFAMTVLDLGSNFDTSNVTDMVRMFANAGFTAMTSLNLGDKFDTSNVTDMREMFERYRMHSNDKLRLRRQI